MPGDRKRSGGRGHARATFPTAAASVLSLLITLPGLRPATHPLAPRLLGEVATKGSSPSASAAIRQVRVEVGSPPLRGTLVLPSGKGPFPAIVLVSGSGPNDQDETVGPDKPFLDIALGLAARGIASLRYDKRTLDYPKSVDPKTFTVEQEYVPDALAAIRLLVHEPDVDSRRIFLLGHSQGGTMAPLIAREAPQLAGVVLLAASTEHIGAALLRQVRYLATLPGEIGAQARAELAQVVAIAEQVSDEAALEDDKPGTVLLGGVGPAYYLSDLRYDPVPIARDIRQPLLLLQGDRDYQVTVKDDLDVWLKGLSGRKGVTVAQFPDADHLFIDGTGPPSPADYVEPGHVDPAVIAKIASWVFSIGSA